MKLLGKLKPRAAGVKPGSVRSKWSRKTLLTGRGPLRQLPALRAGRASHAPAGAVPLLWPAAGTVAGGAYIGASTSCLGVPWVPRVVRGDEVSFTCSFDQGPTFGGLQPVVVAAEPVEQLEHRDVGVRPIFAVVGLQETSPRATALGRTGREEPVESTFLVGVGAPAHVHDTDDLFAVGDDGLQHRVASCDHVAHCFDRCWPKAGYVAYLAVDWVAAQQGAVVDPHHDLGPGAAAAAATTVPAAAILAVTAGAATTRPRRQSSSPGRPGRPRHTPRVAHDAPLCGQLRRLCPPGGAALP